MLRNTALLRRLRWFVLGTGPFERRCDRDRVLGRSAVVLALLLSPPLAVATASATTGAPPGGRGGAGGGGLAHHGAAAGGRGQPRARRGRPGPVRAQWTAGDGVPREGLALAAAGTDVGTELTIWVDGEGRLTRAPLDRAAIRTSALTVGLPPLIGLPVATWTLYAGLCVALDSRRARRWDAEWAAVEPKWRSRLL